MKRIVKSLLVAIPLMAIIVSCGKEPSQPTVAVTGVTLSPEYIDIEIEDQKVLRATVSPNDATNKDVSFSSSKESVATVSQEGIVEAVAAGKAIVTVTTEDGKYKAHCTVNVLEKVVHVTGIALNKTTLSMKEGDEFTLVPTVTPDNAADKSVNWASDNEAIVTVSSDGVVRALKAGKATVTATTADQGKTTTCSIEVAEGMGAVTGAATHISCRNAEIAGKANLPGTTSTDLSFGVLYSTSSGVFVGSATQIEAKAFDSDYNYSVNTEVLEPETTYYYRSYIIQNTEISYGELKSFKTLPLSSMIQTLDVTDINPKDAVLNAMLDLTDCKYDGLEYGFEISLEDGSTRTIKSSNHSEKKFSVKDESLSRDTEYYAVAYVKLDGRTYKGESKEFTTKSIRAYVTAESLNVSYHTATVSGKLTVESEGSFTKSAVLYYSSTVSTLEALMSNGTKKTLTLGTDGSFSADMPTLVSNTQYNYVVVAKVDEVELNTEVKTFKTLQIVASVTAESSNVSYHTATFFGKLTVEADGTFNESAVLYCSSTASTVEALKSSGTKKTLSLGADGSFNADLSTFVSNTQYNYVVVAKVNEVELNTEVKTFKTLQIVASVTAESSDIKASGATIFGKLVVESEGSFTKSAVLYYSGTASTVDALKSSGTKRTLTLETSGEYSIWVDGLERETNYYCVVASKVDDAEFNSSVISFTTSKPPSCPPGAVDLGLSVCWATCNLGASKPEEYGGYYQWGGLQDVTDTSIYLFWNNCPYHIGSSASHDWTKYIPSNMPVYWLGGGSPDNKTVLDPEDDVAHVKLGGKWRMPTKDEFKELIGNCTAEWTTQNGVKGRKFTSKKNGNSIFLPAAGHRRHDYVYNADTSGLYWSSSLCTEFPINAEGMDFDSGHVVTSNYNRYDGLFVRPVSE